MITIRCLRSYKKLPISDLADFAQGVHDGVYTNTTVFDTPPIADAAFQTLIDQYNLKRSLYENGGLAQKPGWKYAQSSMLDALNETADYVDTKVDGNENIVILGGYKPTKSVRSEGHTPDQLVDITLTRGTSGKLFAECEKQVGVDVYICIMTKDAPLPDDVDVSEVGDLLLLQGTSLPTMVIDFTSSRKKKFVGLTPGSTYYFVFFGINARGVGDFSEVKSIMCV